MKFADCYKCGKTKLCSINIEEDDLEGSDLEMTEMGWGKHQGQYYCKDCDEESEFGGEE